MATLQTSQRPSVKWKPLTAVVRRIQDQHPEWVGTDLTDAIKTELVRQGFEDPRTDRVYQALDAVHRARAQVRRRPAAQPSMPPLPAAPPLTREESRDVLRALCEHFAVGGVKVLSTVQTPGTDDERAAAIRRQAAIDCARRAQAARQA